MESPPTPTPTPIIKAPSPSSSSWDSGSSKKPTRPPRQSSSSKSTKTKTTASPSGTTSTSEGSSSSKGSSTMMASIKSETRSPSFSETLKRISEDHPPTKNPIGYSVTVIAALCCAGTAVCIVISLFCFIQLIPIAAIIVGGVYFNRNKYCPGEDIPSLLIVGGALQMIQVILSEAFTVRTTRRKLAMIAFDSERDESLLISSNKSTMTTTPSKIEGDIAADSPPSPPGKTASQQQQQTTENAATAPKLQNSRLVFEPNVSSSKHDHATTKTKVEVEIVVVEETEDNLGTYFHIANIILTVANVLWFFSASIIVYRLNRKLNSAPEYECDSGLYGFAFWYITSFYIVLGIVLVGVVLFSFSGRVVGWIFKKWDNAQQAQNNN